MRMCPCHDRIKKKLTVEDGSATYQLVVVDNHQLDVLGLRLDGALTSPHLSD